MIEVARRRKAQAPPPSVVFEALSQPDREPTRKWLRLAADEIEPSILEAEPLSHVVWSSLWPAHPSALITYEIEEHERGPIAGSYLTWILTLDAEIDGDEARRLRRRLNELINNDLRNDLFDQ